MENFEISKIEYIGDNPEEYTRIGYNVIDVPIEFKGRFELDLQAALMNIAGISISDVLKFIPYDIVEQCYCTDKNPFKTNIISIGMKDNNAISDFFEQHLIPSSLYSRPIAIHLDASLTGDRTGLSATAAMGYIYKNDYDINQGKMLPTKKMVFKNLFTIGIQAPPKDEISFQKTRDFIYYLRNVLGWNIKFVSTDGFQSADCRQQLRTMGFNAELLSLDRSSDGYMSLKAALGEKRISIYHIEELETELIQLERDNNTGKVDHPVSGTKDMSDALAGSLYSLMLHEKDLNLYVSELASALIDSNDTEKVIDYRDKLLSGILNVNKYDQSQISSSIIETPDIIQPSSDDINKTIMETVKHVQDVMNTQAEQPSVPSTQTSTEPPKPRPTPNVDPNEEARRRFLAARAAQRSAYSQTDKSIDERIQTMRDISDGILI